MRIFLVSLAMSGLVACSSPDFATGPVASEDAGADAASDSVVDTTPVEKDTRPVDLDGKPPFTCGGPSDCGPDKKYCCADIELGAGTMPSCPLTTGTTACAASCPTNIPFSCPGKGKVKLCKKPDDCADDTANPNCCTIAASGTSGSFCVSDLVKGFAISCL